MSTPFFSIIIPVYNLERYVREAIDSVLGQTFKDFECICIDDGSTDESPRILDEYACEDARVKVIHQKNGGEGAARNSGFSAARGLWLAFLDGDDLLHPQALELCKRIIDRHVEVDAVRFGYEHFNDGAVWNHRVIDADDVVTHQIDCSGKLTYEMCEWSFWAHVYRREVVADIRQDPLCVGTDRICYARYLLRLRAIASIAGCALYGYRQRLGSAINSKPSLRKVQDECHWRVLYLMILEQSGRGFVSGYARSLSRGTTEWVSDSLFKLSGKEKRIVWNQWLDDMREVAMPGVFSGWWLFATKICLCTKSWVLFWLLFNLPLRLKRVGIHR